MNSESAQEKCETFRKSVLVSIIETYEITFLVRRKLSDSDITFDIIAPSSAAFNTTFVVALLFLFVLPKFLYHRNGNVQRCISQVNFQQ